MKNKHWTIYERMLCYCLKCRKNTESKNQKVVKAKNGRRILLSIVLCVIVKSWNLLKSTKLENY